MRFLGIDPGLRLTGYGCLEVSGRGERLVEAGVIRLARAAPRDPAGPALSGSGDRGAASVSARLVELERDLSEIIGRLRPDSAAVEQVFAHVAHPATAIIMGHARGVILLCIRRAGLPLVELRPTEVKKALTGHGQAGKPQMQRAVQAVFGLAEPPKPPDVADAIAIALCAARRSRLEAASAPRQRPGTGPGT